MSALRWRWHRIRGGWRCKVGVHRWRGHMDCGDGVNVTPWHPRRPRPGAWRVCTWCGATDDVYYGFGRGFYWARASHARRAAALPNPESFTGEA